jgi:hypothetical protein
MGHPRVSLLQTLRPFAMCKVRGEMQKDRPESFPYIHKDI